MKVSVILATYNRAATVLRAVLSIKSQTYTNIQMIVVDGDSQDDTVSIVEPFLSGDDVLQSEPDAGIYDALNKGLALATGDIIAFLHSDDLFFDDNIIATVVAAFSESRVDLVYGDISFFSGTDVTKVKRRYRSDEFTERNLAWGHMPAHPGIFIRREIYDEVGLFETDYAIAADYEFLCRVIKHPNLKTLYLRSILVRMQLGGISTRGFKSTLILNREVIRALRSNGIYTNILMILSKYPRKILQYFRI